MSGKSVFVLLAILISFGAWKHFHNSEAAVVAMETQAPPDSRGTVLVYGRDSCGYTRRTLAFLKANGVPTTYRDVDVPAINDEFQSRFADSDLAGPQGFPLPIVEIGGHASARPDPNGLLTDYRISQRIAAAARDN